MSHSRENEEGKKRTQQNGKETNNRSRGSTLGLRVDARTNLFCRSGPRKVHWRLQGAMPQKRASEELKEEGERRE
jgi:hypothetical protein